MVYAHTFWVGRWRRHGGVRHIRHSEMPVGVISKRCEAWRLGQGVVRWRVGGLSHQTAEAASDGLRWDGLTTFSDSNSNNNVVGHESEREDAMVAVVLAVTGVGVAEDHHSVLESYAGPRRSGRLYF